MIKEISAAEMDARSQSYATVKTGNTRAAAEIMRRAGLQVVVNADEARVYDTDDTGALVKLLIDGGQTVSEVRKHEIGLEEYYIGLMSGKEVS